MTRMSAARVRDLVLGVVALGLVASGLVVAYLSYSRALVPHEDVTLRTDVVGNALQVGSDVKFNGVPIGRVDAIESTDAGADLTLSINPADLGTVPADVVARLLPKTMFGERYVALVRPSGSTARAAASTERLQAGDVITQDESAEAAELQQVFDEMLPTLRAIQPEKLSAMLSEFAAMLDGNGEALGDSLVAWSSYAKKMNPKVPQMVRDLDRLAVVADSWSIAAPDLLDALATMTTSSKTLVAKREGLSDLYASVIGSADTTNGWLGQNHDTIEVLSRESRAALRASSPYAAQFPCLFRAVAGMKPRMDKALGKGTDEPGVHAVLQVMPARSKYLVGKDDITYTKGTPGPRCPYVTGEVGTEAAKASTGTTKGTWPAVEGSRQTGDQTGDSAAEPPSIAPPPGTGGQVYLHALTGLGEANSPGENQLIAELVGPTRGLAPAEFPRWGSLLLGPTLRNTKVVLK